MALDEFGILEDCEIEKLRSKKVNPGAFVKKVDHVNESLGSSKNTRKPENKSAAAAPKASEVLSKEAALQVALELEAWKEQQQILFRKQVRFFLNMFVCVSFYIRLIMLIALSCQFR